MKKKAGRIGQMPSPPEFLQKKIETNLVEDIPSTEDVIKAQEELEQWVSPGRRNSEIPPEQNHELIETATPAEPVQPAKPAGPSLHVPQPKSPHFDAAIYQRAIEERRAAEIQYGEMYSQYLQVVAFNEKLLRARGAINRYRRRVRHAYDRALKGDQHLRESFQIIQRNLVAAEKAMSSLQIENESLRISIDAHDEGYKTALAQAAALQNERDNAIRQFQALSDEFINRGVILDEADRKIRDYVGQIEMLGHTLHETQKKYDQIREENFGQQNELRETQLREAAMEAMNEELARAVSRSQKQIHQLEEKLRDQNSASQMKIKSLEEEVARLRENRHAEKLVAQSMRLQESATVAAVKASKEGEKIQKKQWDDFYKRWSNIIDELSSHAKPLERRSKEDDTAIAPPQLLSEIGDLDII